jgi:malate synthase
MISRQKIKKGYLVADCLYELVNDDVLPGLSITATEFWSSTADILEEFIPWNKKLLEERENLQQKINQWHLDKTNLPFSQSQYEGFLKQIGYLVSEQDDFLIGTDNVDSEVAVIAGPQLVVPLMNARFAINAANARWGSLYDALYGSDVIGIDNGGEATKAYNPVRGLRVQKYGRDFLNSSIPLNNASHHDVVHYFVVNNMLRVKLSSGKETTLVKAEQFKGFKGLVNHPDSVLFYHNGLHLELQIDKDDVVGKTDAANVKNIILEAAISTIQDCEDSIAAVDAADKTLVYRNWLGLMKGDLTETISKDGKEFVRRLNPDRSYLSPLGKPFSLPGRSLQFIRNVGLLMTTDAIVTASLEEVPEGIVDALITTLISLHDVKNLESSSKHSDFKNSRKGSIYIVKPKMHGPEEVRFSDQLFSRLEQVYKLPANTIKMGIMDEERRTSANLKECIRAAKDRVAFINTGFLDRTGDEIHTSMEAGPMVCKDDMKNKKWISVYEERNVRFGLQTGFIGKAQIGKGMWAVPDEMAAMMDEKDGHPLSGASCAWVPSPTAAVLHALHYHQINVSQVQHELLEKYASSTPDDITDLLTIPLLKDKDSLSDEQIQNELDNNIQGLLGYVVRWIDQGIGCSKVPDIHHTGRMEDRATLRISSQHICNWLHHKIIDKQQVIESLKKMAQIVDEQNANDPSYQKMSINYKTSIAFLAAMDLIFEGRKQPSGYTEPLLHKRRKEIKQLGV